MAEIVGWAVITTFVLAALGIIDLTVHVASPGEGEKTICIRGKDGNGQ